MSQPAFPIATVEQAASSARVLETPSEVRRFAEMAAESTAVREFIKTPEWDALFLRIVGDGNRPTGRPKTLADLSRRWRWQADSAPSEDVRAAFLQCALQIDVLARDLERGASKSSAAAAAALLAAAPAA